jgi:hypothetical protein
MATIAQLRQQDPSLKVITRPDGRRSAGNNTGNGYSTK